MTVLSPAILSGQEKDSIRYRTARTRSRTDSTESAGVRLEDSPQSPGTPEEKSDETSADTGEPPPPAPAETSAPSASLQRDASPPWFDFLLPSDNLSGKGLLTLQDPFPLAQLHLQLPVQTLLNLDEGETLIETRLNWANSFALLPDDALLIDAETLQAQFGLWYALTDDFAVGAEVSLLWRGDGILDPIVDGFHDAFGLGTANRELRPRNDYSITIRDEGRPVTLDSGVGLGDTLLKAHWTVNRGDRFLPSVAMQSFLSLPTSTSGFGSAGLDMGISLTMTKRILGVVVLYGVLGGTYFSDPDIKGLRYERLGYQGTFGFEIELFDELSAVFQFTRYSALLEGPAPLDNARNYVAGGLKWEVTQGLTVEATLLENTAPFDNSADIAFQLGFSWQL